MWASLFLALPPKLDALWSHSCPWKGLNKPELPEGCLWHLRSVTQVKSKVPWVCESLGGLKTRIWSVAVWGRYQTGALPLLYKKKGIRKGESFPASSEVRADGPMFSCSVSRGEMGSLGNISGRKASARGGIWGVILLPLCTLSHQSPLSECYLCLLSNNWISSLSSCGVSKGLFLGWSTANLVPVIPKH